MAQVQIATGILASISQICRGAPDTTLVEAYIHAVRRLCSKSRVFGSTLAGVTTAPFTTPYTTGTVTVTNASASVTGAGTAWLAQAAPGDTFTSTDGVEYTVASVASDTALALTAVYGGATLAGQAYSIGRDRGVSVYNLGSDTYSEIIGVRAVSLVDGNEIVTLDPKGSGTWDANDARDVPAQFDYVPEAQLALHPAPDAAYRMSIALVLQPKLGSNSIDDSLLVKWEEAFRCGALSYLLGITGMPWTNERKSEVQEAKFLDWMNRATSAAERRYRAGDAGATPW